MLIAIDHGNCRIKTIRNAFVSGYTKFGNEPPMASDVIHFGDNYYALTETRIPFQFDKTQREDYYILTLFAIAKEIEKMGAYQPELNVELAVGLPPIHYGLLKQRFIEYLSHSGQWVNFVYNGKSYSIRITRVFVFPQAYAAVTTHLSEFQKLPYVIIVDIGGFTVDTLMLKRGIPDMEYCLSLELGIIKLYNKASQKGLAKFGHKIMPDDIDDILLGRSTMTGDIKALVNELAQAQVDSIFSELREHDMDISAQPSVFIGGGSNVLHSTILHSRRISADNTIFMTNTNANACGYYAIAKSILDRENRVGA